MPISRKDKFIFIHIPRCGGESMEKALGLYGLNLSWWRQRRILWGARGHYMMQHLTAEQIRSKFVREKTFEKYFKFAFIRNPWDRAVSEYHWYCRWSECPIPFKGWVEGLAKRINTTSEKTDLLFWGHNLPCSEFLYAGDECLVDFVGRFENIAEDFIHVTRRIGKENIVLRHDLETASQGRMPYQDYYDGASRKIIADLYEEDIRRFGYDF